MGLGKTIRPSSAKLPVIFLIDVSYSMQGTKIDSVNNAMVVAIETLQEKLSGNTDTTVIMNVLKFGCAGDDPVQWMYEEMSPLNAFEWMPLKAEEGTPLGEAFVELDSKLSRSAFLNVNSAICAPVLILISDGNPSNSKKAKEGLELLKTNAWFNSAERMALAIDYHEELGDDPYYLEEFVKGSPHGQVCYEVESADRLIASIQGIVINTTLMGATRMRSSTPAIGTPIASSEEPDPEQESAEESAEENATESNSESEEDSEEEISSEEDSEEDE